MIRFLRALVGCTHKHMRRETREGIRYFVCACGYAVEQIKRETDNPMARRPAHELMKAKRANVVRPMRKVKG